MGKKPSSKKQQMSDHQKLLLCTRCKMQYYSSKEEQVKDYPNHKSICRKTETLKKQSLFMKTEDVVAIKTSPKVQISFSSEDLRILRSESVKANDIIVTRKQRQERKKNQMDLLRRLNAKQNPRTGLTTLNFDPLILPLDFMLTSLSFLECFGPILLETPNEDKLLRKWNLGPSQVTLQELAFQFIPDKDGKNPTLVPFNPHFSEAPFLLEYKDFDISLPTQMLQMHFKTLNSCDLQYDSDSKIFARPENRPDNVSMMDWWAFYTSSKSELFTLSLVAAMTILSQVRAFIFEGELVKEWGIVDLCYVKPDFIPISKRFRWEFTHHDLFSILNVAEDKKKDNLRRDQEKTNLLHECTGCPDDLCGLKIRSNRFRRTQREEQTSVEKDSELLSEDGTMSCQIEEIDMLPDACTHHALCIVLHDGTKRYMDFCASTFFATKKKDDQDMTEKERHLFTQADSSIPVLYSHSEMELKKCGFILKPRSEMRKFKSVRNFIELVCDKFPTQIDIFVILLSNLVRGFVTNFPHQIKSSECQHLIVKPPTTAVWQHLEKLKKVQELSSYQ